MGKNILPFHFFRHISQTTRSCIEIRCIDLLRIKASINYAGNTSMEIGVKVDAENFITGKIRPVAFAYLTFVALDNELKPRKVPPLIIKNDKGRKRNNEAKERLKIRKKSRRLEKEM